MTREEKQRNLVGKVGIVGMEEEEEAMEGRFFFLEKGRISFSSVRKRGTNLPPRSGFTMQRSKYSRIRIFSGLGQGFGLD